MSINPNVIGMDYVALMVFLWMTAAFDYQKRIQDDFVLETANANAYLIRIAFLVLGAMAAFRSLEITNDTKSYYAFYSALYYYGVSNIKRIEKGYILLNELFLFLFKNTKTGFHLLQIVIAAFSYYSVERYIEKRSSSYGICVLLFYFLINGSYMSAMRQSTAIAIVLLAIELLKKKKYFLYILAVALAAQFHSTAWIALLFLFIYGRKFNYLVMGGSLIGAIILTIVNFPDFLASALNYGNVYISEEIHIRTDMIIMSVMYIGLLALRVLLPAHFSDFDEEKIWNEEMADNDFYCFCIGLSLVFTILSLRSPALTRFTLYTNLAGLPYIANTLNKIEDHKVSFDIKVILCGATWAYSFIALLIRPEWQHLWPYRFFWMD